MSGTFITTGNLRSDFPSMAAFIEANGPQLSKPLIVQTLAPDVRNAAEFAGAAVHDLFESSEFKSQIRDAACLIGHCGVGFLSDCLGFGKLANFLPRSVKFGEHIDDHQHELASLVAHHELGKIISGSSKCDELLMGSRHPSAIRVDLARHLPKQTSFVVVSSSGGHLSESAETVAELQANGCQHLCTIVDEPIWQRDQFHQVLPSCGTKVGMLKALPRIVYLLYRYRPGFVLTHGAGVGLVGALAARLLRVPVFACESVTRIQDSGRWFKGAILVGARCYAPDHARYLEKQFFRKVTPLSFAIVPTERAPR